MHSEAGGGQCTESPAARSRICAALLFVRRCLCGRGISSSTRAPFAEITSCQGIDARARRSGRTSVAVERLADSADCCCVRCVLGICASNVKRTIRAPPATSAPSHGVCAITLSTSTASADGSRRDKCAHSTIETGTSRRSHTKRTQTQGNDSERTSERAHHSRLLGIVRACVRSRVQYGR